LLNNDRVTDVALLRIPMGFSLSFIYY